MPLAQPADIGGMGLDATGSPTAAALGWKASQAPHHARRVAAGDLST